MRVEKYALTPACWEKMSNSSHLKIPHEHQQRYQKYILTHIYSLLHTAALDIGELQREDTGDRMKKRGAEKRYS